MYIQQVSDLYYIDQV